MQLSVIIASYNVKFYLAQCVASLYKAGKDIEMEIIVVDNNSHDGTEKFLQEAFPEAYNHSLHFIGNKVNVGFGKANNQGLKTAKGEYILFINPDTFIAENTLKNCLSIFKEKKNAGVVGIRMLNADGSFASESRRGVPTPMTSFYKLCGLAKLFPKSKIFGKYYMKYLDEKQICAIDIVSGAFMMIPHTILEQCGAFDEDFFMYGEDVELSYRILKAGYQNYYVPTRMLHYKGESTNKASIQYVNAFYKAMLIFFRKHYPKAQILYALVFFGIYLLAFKTLVVQWQLKLLEKLGINKTYRTIYAFFGSEEMLKQCRRACQQNKMEGLYFPNITDATTCIKQIPANKSMSRTYAVFDTNKYSYEEILEAFDNSQRKDLVMGIYYPAQQNFDI